MKSVVTSVVTIKSGLTNQYHCENPIKRVKRVVFIPLYITKMENSIYSQQLTPVFEVTTEVTTVSDQNHRLGGHIMKRHSYTNWNRAPPEEV